MNFTEEQIQLIVKNANKILREQSEVLAERLIEDYHIYQTVQQPESIEYACQYCATKLVNSLTDKNLSEEQINFSAYIIKHFTKYFVNQVTYQIENRYANEPLSRLRLENELINYFDETFSTNRNSIIGDFKKDFRKQINQQR